MVYLSMNFVCSVCARVFVLFVCLGGKRKEGRDRDRREGVGEREEAPQHAACRLWGGIPFLHKFWKGQHYSLQRQVYGRSKIAGSYNKALPTIWPSFTSTQPTHGFGQVFPCNINYVGRAHAHGRCGRRGEGRDGEKSMFCSCSCSFSCLRPCSCSCSCS